MKIYPVREDDGAFVAFLKTFHVAWFCLGFKGWRRFRQAWVSGYKAWAKR